MIKAVTVYNKINRLRRAIRAEGTTAVQDAWDDVEPHVSVFMNDGIKYGTAGTDQHDQAGSGHVGQSRDEGEV